MDAKPDNNIILTQTEGLTMNPRPANPKYARNKNMLVIGGSGSGKTRFVLKPNLMQCKSKDYPVSFVCTDPKGELLDSTAKMLQRHGYRIKIFNTINFKKSHHYNPFSYADVIIGLSQGTTEPQGFRRFNPILPPTVGESKRTEGRCEGRSTRFGL